MPEVLQKKGPLDEDELQFKSKEAVQKKGPLDEDELQFKSKEPVENNTGLPDNLKAGVENLSGMAMDDVRVHYNSGKPAQLNAYAYTQGTEIHVAPGQKKHLPHEAWHVVQQKQGRVQPTMQMAGGVLVNDDKGLEKESEDKGTKSLQLKKVCSNNEQLRMLQVANHENPRNSSRGQLTTSTPCVSVIQCQLDFSKLNGANILEQAINIFHQIELDDITQKELTELQSERNRFVPLLGRFSLARNTTLVVCPALKSRTGDMAVTELYCETITGNKISYDKNQSEFNNAMSSKSIKSFEIQVLFWNLMVKGPATHGTLKSVGTILQALTHELAVHAENMLDLTEDYWNYYDGDPKTPLGLPLASDEHSKFKAGKVTRYEYMKNRVTLDPKYQNIGTDFGNRENDDKRTAL